MQSPHFGKSVFKDIGKLSFDYVPEELPHREKEIQRLIGTFTALLFGNVSQNVLITGSVGTGKTVLAKYLCSSFQKFSRENGKNVQYVEVNCRRRPTENAVILKILNHFAPNFPDRGFSITEMLESLQKHIVKEKAQLIIILDEFDVLIKKSKSDLIYALTRFDAESSVPKGSISLIAISQKNVLDLLDSATLSTFKRTNVIELNKYSQPELCDIIQKRVELALHPGVADNDISSLISEAASEYGDARFAIELLEKSGMLADEEGKDIMTPEHVRRARAETHSTITEEKIRELDINKKLVLLAISRSLKNKAYTTTGEAEKAYELVCEEYNTEKRGHTQFWKYITDLDAVGIISAKESGKGIAGHTTVISILDIPVLNLERNLVEMLKEGKGEQCGI
ncbi:MAG: AAA family ATPase [Thermoplasmata archaeon]